MKIVKHNYLLDFSLVVILCLLYILVRSINFIPHLNFSSEQASFALKARELFESRKIELIGPPISWRFNGRYFFQGSITYYVMIPLLLLGNWDPVVSSYMMVLFGAVMLIPLYFGTKLLFNRKAALVLSFIFCFLPLYIDYSRFFWNPNLQFLFAPLVILWMGLFEKYKKVLFLFLVSFASGVLMLFHYQFFLVILGLIFYYLFYVKLALKNKLVFLSGFPVGFAPLIIFELRNQFYNLNTLCLFFINFKEVFLGVGHQSFAFHYILSILLFIFLVLSKYISKISSKFLLFFGIFTGACVLIYYSIVPSHGFGMAKDWNYSVELKAHNIIKAQKVQNYNIVNLGYDTIATTQKYLLIKEGVKMNFDDYYHNDYLFLITNKQDYMKNPAYEINTFRPNMLLKTWKLNERYNLFLLKRLK